MKRLWSIRKRDDAVSPVIATILMVAITVVLAAVLYVMVLGFGGDGGGKILITMDEGSTATNWTFSVLAIEGVSGNLPLDEVFIIAYDEDGAVVLSQTRLSLLGSGNNSGVWFIDATNAAYLEVGDKFHLMKSEFGQGSEFTLNDGAGETHGTYVA